MKDNYDKISSENWQLNALLPGSSKTRKREEQETKPWRKLETKPEWRKRNVRLWEASVTRGDKSQDMQFEQFLDYKRKVLDTF